MKHEKKLTQTKHINVIENRVGGMKETDALRDLQEYNNFLLMRTRNFLNLPWNHNSTLQLETMIFFYKELKAILE